MSLINHAIQLTSYTPTLQYTEIPVPTLSSNQVLVKVLVRPVNPADLFSIVGHYPGFKPSNLPATPGLEGMGIVMDSNNHLNFPINTRVVPFFDTLNGNGSWCEYVAVDINNLIKIPDNITDEAACQLIVNPITCYGLLNELNAPENSYIIQTAAGSVLGRQFIAMAKLRGLKTINLVRRKEQVEELLAIGADHVVWTDAPDTNITDEIKKITGPSGAYGAIDCISGPIVKSVMGALRDGGSIFLFGAMNGIIYEGNVIDNLFRDVRVRGFWLATWLRNASDADRSECFKHILDLMGSGKVVPFAGEKFDLKDAAVAIEKSKEVARGGKILLVSKN